MGKTQSKRSVDITTEGKKGPEEEVTGKLEKIDDLDQKQVNGDATPQDNIEAEKKDADESENDKDLTTEKSAEVAQGGGDGAEQNNTATGMETLKGEESPATTEGEKIVGASGTEEISPLADESNKKPKKEKVKKKWSFRSISFGKKDKQKPAKAEEGTAENAGAMNGEAAVTAEKAEGTTESVKNDEDGEETEVVKTAEKLENGDATEKELNGQKTPTSTPTVEKVVTNDSTTKITATADSNETTASETNQTEKKGEAIEAADAAPAMVSNGTATEKNGIDVPSSVDDMKEAVRDDGANVVEAPGAVVDKIKSIPSVVSDGCDVAPHQNGTSADGETVEPKTQTEVIIQNITTPTENLATTTLSSAHTLSISSIPLDPNAQSQQTKSDANSNKNENKISIDASVAAGARVAVESETLSPVPPVAVVDDANHGEPPKHEPGAGNCEAVSRAAVQSDCQQPPPLPVSPPPSQVSVFAFTDQAHVGEVMTAPETQESPTPLPLAAKPENDVITTAVSAAATVAEEDTKEIMPTVTSTAAIDQKLAEDRKVEDETVLEQTPQQTTEINCEIEETSKSSASEILPDKTEEFLVAKAVVDEVTKKAVEMVQSQNEQEISQKPELKLESSQQPQQQQEAYNKSDVADVTAVQVQEDINCMTSPIDGIAAASAAVQALPATIESGNSNLGILSEYESASKCDLTVPHATPTATVVAPFHSDTQEQNEQNEGEEKMREEEDCSMLGVKDIENLTVSSKGDDRGDNDNDSISPSKEITNAMDLKEKAAVEITQDLPVTCE